MNKTCPDCNTKINIGGLIGKAGKAKAYCLRHWKKRVTDKQWDGVLTPQNKQGGQ